MDVDLFGLPADHEAVAAVCKKHGLLFLEDAAQGFGGMLHGKRNGAFGDAACTSFFPAKPLGCYGDGGAVFTDSDETAAMIRSLCVHGKGSFKYDNVRIGMNSRLDTIQAAILLAKMDALEKYELADVNAAAAMYNEALAGIPAILPVVPEGWYSSWAQYTLRLRSREERDRVQAELKAQGIPTMVYYPKPMHTQQAFDGLKQYIPCPVTEELCATVLSLPMHPYLTRETVQTVAASLGKYTAGYCLLACLERVSAMLLHISLSVFVFAAARSRAKRGYLAFAIGLHAIFDMPAALYQFGYVKQLFPVELWLAVCALYALRSARKCYLEECDA